MLTIQQRTEHTKVPACMELERDREREKPTSVSWQSELWRKLDQGKGGGPIVSNEVTKGGLTQELPFEQGLN